MRDFKKQIGILLCVMLAVVVIVAFPSMASEKDTGSITLEYEVPECTFQVYHVANYDDQGKFVLTDEFSKLNIDWSSMDNEDWYQLAKDLSVAVLDTDYTYKSGATDKDGKVSFDNLTYGLYLMVGETKVYNDLTYNVQPLMIAVPGVTEEQKVEADRYFKLTKFDHNRMTEITVKKVWEGTGYPESIKVHLYRNGEVFDTQELSAENDWRFTWELEDLWDIDAGYYKWTVKEDVPKGYIATYADNGTSKIITNKKPPENNPPDNPDGGRLPQTGLDWMPAIILCIAGLICLIIGVIRRRRND